MPQKKTAKKQKSKRAPKQVAKKTAKRDLSLDFLRGLAVILMIITHVNGIFYGGEFVIFRFFTWWGATVCFTIFLFVFASIIGMKIELGKVNKEKMAIRFFKFLLVYYLTAFILIAIGFGSDVAIREIRGIITFQLVPEFIEFILAFILYGFIIVLTPQKILKYLTNVKVIVPLALIIFAITKLLYPIETDSYLLISIKSLFTGHEDLHSFGVLSYFPVFALGLWWGGNKIRTKGNDRKTTGILLISSFLIYLFLILTGLSKGNRWPPSLTFMLYGVWFSFAVLLISDKLMKIKYFGESVIFIGVYAFRYYIIHIILLYMIADLTGWVNFTEIPTLLILSLSFTVPTLLIILEKGLKERVSGRYTH